ncbi:MAG: hypothetical protein M3Y45_05800 [Actinomycetota bacterium]|nr:hypothetical protein [Actinomycetota bacterium]
MGRETGGRMFARAVAAFGLAATISIGIAGFAGAAPADRAGDPVVLKGSSVPSLNGTAPDGIVGFKWTGKWTQIPVQIDERHTIDVRQLYPSDPSPGYVGSFETAFPVELYADPKTRSGADSNRDFDADDELVFMAGDSGRQARAGVTVPPEGVVPGSARAIAVADAAGAGTGYVYLFRSKGSLKPDADKSYVEYDFNLTRLTEGQTMLNDYGYSNSNNPEDSTVSTANYTLHSTDRWMEDRMEIHAGSANGIDILDREVAQATLTGCGRSEFTFSGNWNRGSDQDEGTYVAVKNGPVRAVRSYMGANSGPYVQRDHIYYSEREDNTVHLRVHPMTDLYTWTDYSENATGMTYRDFRNQDGVPVDGAPDTLDPATANDFAPGSWVWQQLAGPQGSVTTVTSADTDIPNANFGSYYLDQANPTGPREKQCGGDMKSFGASGFGTLGTIGSPITPNTDPRLGEHFDLAVKRVRYFGAPEVGATEAANLAARVKQPLSATDSGFKPGVKKPKLKVKVTGGKIIARKGKRSVLRARISNAGLAPAKAIKVCVKSSPALFRGCFKAGSLKAGGARNWTGRVKVRKSLKRGKKVKVALTVRAKGAKAAKANRKLRVR